MINVYELKYGDVLRLKYMKSSFIVEYIGGYTLDNERIIEVKFRGDIYVFPANCITLEKTIKTEKLEDADI